MIIKTFFNWTTEDFTYPYGGDERTFRAGAQRDMDAGMADFFAKHLADWWMDKKGIPASQRQTHKDFMEKCYLKESEPVSEMVAEDAIINQEMPEPEAVAPKEKKKPGRPAKVVAPKVEEFEGVEA